MINNALYSSKNDNWSTPQWLYDELDAEFNFTLDVCADEKNAKCERFYTVEVDGLSQNWGGCYGVLQSAIFKYIGLGEKVLRGRTQAEHNGCFAYSIKNRYKVFSQLHIAQIGDALY